MKENWRFIKDEAFSGSVNMAADQMLLKTFSSGTQPVIRFYKWKTPTLSLGKNQRLGQINLKWCYDNNISIVRRSTGGQAVLHGSDLTYSIIADVNSSRFSGGILKTYQTISECFIHFFKSLGLSPQLQEHTRRQRNAAHRMAQASDVCFVVPSSFEILINARKIIGSAQRQTSKSFLQHGSIPIQDQVPLLTKIFKNTTEENLREKLTSLEALRVLDSYQEQELWDLLAKSFQDIFQIQLRTQEWSVEEWSAIEAEKSQFEWTA